MLTEILASRTTAELRNVKQVYLEGKVQSVFKMCPLFSPLNIFSVCVNTAYLRAEGRNEDGSTK